MNLKPTNMAIIVNLKEAVLKKMVEGGRIPNSGICSFLKPTDIYGLHIIYGTYVSDGKRFFFYALCGSTENKPFYFCSDLRTTLKGDENIHGIEGIVEDDYVVVQGGKFFDGLRVSMDSLSKLGFQKRSTKVFQQRSTGVFLTGMEF